MADNTKIEWADHTFNPWEGCQKVGPGCDHCYAEARNSRFGGGAAPNWGPGAPRRMTSDANWRKPLNWHANAIAFMIEHGRRPRVFCASLADVFDNAVGPMWRARLALLIEHTPALDWLLLTKRIGNAGAMLREMFGDGVMRNVWLGATIVNRDEMLRDAPKLKATPAVKHFWSVEPMLGDLGEIDRELLPDWVICGGESGPNARPMHPDWATGLRDQCAAARVPFLFKQWGEWAPHPSGEPVTVRQYNKSIRYIDRDTGAEKRHPGRWPDATMRKIGKACAGRLLDGVLHDGFPVMALIGQ